MDAICPICGSSGYGRLDSGVTTTSKNGRTYKRYTCRTCDTKFTVSYQTQNRDEFYEKLLRAGQKIKAIKAYRAVTGAGLKESKDYMDELEFKLIEAGKMTRMNRLGLRMLRYHEIQEIKRELHNERKITAIKLYRSFTGAGLRDAKAFVDGVEMQMVNDGDLEPRDYMKQNSSGQYHRRW